MSHRLSQPYNLKAKNFSTPFRPVLMKIADEKALKMPVPSRKNLNRVNPMGDDNLLREEETNDEL